MKKSLTPILLGALFMLPVAAVQAHSTDGFVTDGSGKLITDGYGECVSFGKLKHQMRNDGKCEEKAKPVAKKPKPEPKPAPQPVKETITLGASALFDTNKSVLRPEGIAELNGVVAKLKSFSSLESIEVVGHTDSRASEKYNQALSERRAAAVKTHLMNKGIDGSKISTSGKGELSPIADNKTKEGRQKNRRVEITIKATQNK